MVFLLPLIWPHRPQTSPAAPGIQTVMDDLIGFAFGRRNLEDCWASIGDATLMYLAQTDPLSGNQLDLGLLIERILQGKSWQECDNLPEPKSRKQGLHQCRSLVTGILKEILWEESVPHMTRHGISPD